MEYTQAQGLTQTFIAQWSTQPPVQLRGSGGSTNFCVVLTTITTLENLEPNFFTPVMCFHIVNFVEQQQETQSSRMMIHFDLNNSCPS